MLSDLILDEAKTWEGTRYSNYKCEKGRAVDCLNYMGGTYKSCGIISEVPTKKYDRKFWLRQEDLLLEGIKDALKLVNPGYHVEIHEVEDTQDMFWKMIARPGDMLLVKTIPSLKYANHAVFLGCDPHRVQTWIWQADSVRGKVLFDVMPKRWKVVTVVKVLYE